MTTSSLPLAVMPLSSGWFKQALQPQRDTSTTCYIIPTSLSVLLVQLPLKHCLKREMMVLGVIHTLEFSYSTDSYICFRSSNNSQVTLCRLVQSTPYFFSNDLRLRDYCLLNDWYIISKHETESICYRLSHGDLEGPQKPLIGDRACGLLERKGEELNCSTG